MADKTTFSYKAKDEASRIYPEKECCKRAELSALLRMDGTVTLGFGGAAGFYLHTEYSSVARKVKNLLWDLYEMDSSISLVKETRLRQATLYRVEVEQSLEGMEILEELGIFTKDWQVPSEIKKFLIISKCCRKAYVRGAFLGGGSITSPELGYHLEIKVRDKDQAKALAGVINRFYDMKAKTLDRKTFWIVYLKDSQQIADFLAIIGAHLALLEYENVRAMKSLNSRVSREVVCETANLQRVANAAVTQIENIRLIKEKRGLDSLPVDCQAVARLRLDHPESSLGEIGQMLDPPLGKSGVNHRMRHITEIANSIKENQEK